MLVLFTWRKYKTLDIGIILHPNAERTVFKFIFTTFVFCIKKQENCLINPYIVEFYLLKYE